ncbi:D-aminoacylase [Halomonas sp. McH1-25]|uniref:N-acyl-D-amino-acid deacylase family protein n=1 Tax=unclassified Halomonas TaxID=2609666 RepID=UPI001EF69CE3|nr:MULTISPECIES: D-aminoacylase [unclassified Halomonas]MCG7599563.1 D-aminoacylase [Halomonas sp. McH1-25]MCP1342164.1 D-aminoacylase [Halomonas sp. FL8]MCP1362374.1 D-aminoacylase [Halomonas sp. BBD45]MCP1366222.1 D-aminoacylase [Halomonas sp. BBD48]
MAYDTLIRGATVIDGTGAAPFRADVAICGERIVAVGKLHGSEAATLIDGEGLCLAPGFIDVHTHDDTNVIRTPEMLPKLSQGVTTVVVGNCGISASPVTLEEDVPDPMNLLGRAEDFRYPTFESYATAVDAARPSVNVAALIGHTSLRSQVMGDFARPANDTEIARMREALRESLDAGALGLSTGLAYRNAFHAPDTEIRSLVDEVGDAGGIYTTHLRDEFAGLHEAMDEAFATARHGRAPLVISHLKCAGAGNWGGAPRALNKLEIAARNQRVHCDCYPYTAGSSTLDLGQVTDEITIFITWSDSHPEMAQRPLRDIAEKWDVTLLEAARRLQPAGAVYHNMSEEDMRRILAHPLAMIGSDGLPNDPHPHPRLWGAFPRVLAHYSRDLQLLPLTEAVRKMTGLSAAQFGLEDRGVVREGAYADLTLFDLARLADVADYTRPIAAAQGIVMVMVNGVIGYREGAATGQRAGRLLRRYQRLSPLPTPPQTKETTL